MAFHPNPQEFISMTMSIGEVTVIWQRHDSFVRYKSRPIVIWLWNDAGRLGAVKQMFRLSQYCCDEGENIARNQIAKVIEEAIEAKDRKTETEDISESHDYRKRGDWLTLMAGRLLWARPTVS